MCSRQRLAGRGDQGADGRRRLPRRPPRLPPCRRCQPGGGGAKIGNAHLKWAFSEAACLLARESAQAKRFLARKEKQHGKPKALGILAARLGRAVYHMLRQKKAFDVKRFWNGEPQETGARAERRGERAGTSDKVVTKTRCRAKGSRRVLEA